MLRIPQACTDVLFAPTIAYMFGSCDQGISAIEGDKVEAVGDRESAVDGGGEAKMRTLGKIATTTHRPRFLTLFLKYIMPYNSSLCAQPEVFQKSGSFCCSQLANASAFAIRSCAILQ